ncbi:MAG TPA: arginine--tRNA ligase, partial [Thermoanaerobaculia bacterium]
MRTTLSLETIRAGIADAVRDAAGRLWNATLDRVVLERPPALAMGDLASPAAFDLAKALRKAPRTIADELAASLSLPEGVREARVEGGGYLNFFLDRGRVLKAMLGEEPASEEKRPGKFIVEHTNINPNKAAHIGHLRNAALGDVLARTLTFLGHRVEVQNYLDDTG